MELGINSKQVELYTKDGVAPMVARGNLAPLKFFNTSTFSEMKTILGFQSPKFLSVISKLLETGIHPAF